MVKECIILAGGLGTRLRTVLSDVPKVMAPVNEKPFLFYLIDHLQKQGINRFIISTGHLNHIIEYWCKINCKDIEIVFSHEEIPLGTGGGIRLAMLQSTTNDVLVINGDTFLDFHYDALLNFYYQQKAACIIALKKMEKFSRYGCVTKNKENKITGFLEKGYHETGYINAGIYLINKKIFLENTPEGTFSFEKEFMEKKVYELAFYGLEVDGYFIDIGIPEDYEKVQLDFSHRFPNNENR